MKSIRTTAFLIIFLLGHYPAYAKGDSHFIKKAAKFAKMGQLDLAFMNYQAVLRNDKLSAQALFASGEYYFLNSFPEKSKTAFKQYIQMTTNIDGKLFALSYLLKISRLQNNQESIKKLETDILSLKRQGFVFKEEKEYQYISPMHRNHKVIYTIDKIAIIIEGQRFEKISF